MSRRAELGAVLLLNLFLGTLYAWSVVARAAEAELAIGRASGGAVFSTATVCFVLAMLATPRSYRWARPAHLAAGAALMAAAGLGVAAVAEDVERLLLGYGVLFGLANGVGYGLSLHVASQVTSRWRGFAVGAVVAAYAGGAALAAPLLAWLLEARGIASTLGLLAGSFLILAAVCGWLLRGSQATGMPPSGARRPDGTLAGHAKAMPWFGRVFLLLWLGYALGASAGLMMIGHAAALVSWQAGAPTLVVLGTVLVSLGNCGGRLGAGWLSDHVPVQHVLLAAMCWNALAFALVLALPSPAIMVAGLGLAGAGYGAMAAAYPIAVGSLFGADRVGPVYGKLFTAWGAAGLGGPWVAGWLFETTGSYGSAVSAALGSTLLAIVVTLALPRAGGVDAPRHARKARLRSGSENMR